MTRPDTTVAADHHPRLTIKDFDVTLLHRVTDNARATSPHYLHVEINRSNSLLLADLFHVPELVPRMLRATHDHNVRWSTDIRQTTRDINRIEMFSTRNQHSNR